MYGTHMRSSSILRGKCYFVPNSNLFNVNTLNERSHEMDWAIGRVVT
jgi:hypothetical protein